MSLLHDKEYQKHHIDPQLRNGFLLNEITVLPKNGEVVRGGTRYHLTPKAFEVLIYLVHHNNRVVSAESLLEFAWGNEKANRSNLSHVISEIRHTLDDHKECPEFIQTFPRKGYRLISKVAPLDEKILYPDIWAMKSGLQNQSDSTSSKNNHWHLSLALLRNSKLFSVSIAFILSTWALLQVFEILFPIFDVPEWGLKIVVLVLVIGFPLVLLFTWLKEIKVKGYLTRSSSSKGSDADSPGSKKHFYKQLAIDFSFIGVLSTGVGFVALYLIESIQVDKDKFVSPKQHNFLNVEVQNDLMAVLPPKFEGSQIPHYFSITFQSELSNSLSRQKFFKVVSPRAVKELPVNSQINEISKKLGARYLLDTLVTELNGEVSIMLSIIDGKSLLQVWTGQLKGSKDKLLTIQKTANRKVASAFQLLSKSEQSLNTIINTEDFKAYDSYIQGKEQFSKSNDEESFLKAQTYFLESLSFDPNFTLANAGLCQSYLSLYEVTHRVSIYQLAVTQCNKLLESKNLKEDGYLALGNLNRISGEHALAINHFLEAQKLSPNNVEVLGAMAKSYSDLGNIEASEALFNKTIKLEPGYWKNYLDFGDFYFAQGQYKKSAEQYAKVTLLKPKDQQAYNRLGAAFYLNNQMPQASTAWKQSLDIKPSANIYSNLATSSFFERNFFEAEKNYLKALELKPDDPVLWGNLGDSQKFSNNNESAYSSYQKALQLVTNKLRVNPNDAESLSEQARYMSELNECKKAIKSSDSLIKRQVNDPYVFYSLSIVQINCQNLVEANALLKMAISAGYSQQLINLDIQFDQLRKNSITQGD